MRATRLTATSGTFVSSFLMLCGSVAIAQPTPADRDAELDTRRLTGKAYYENDKFTEAADEFRRCIELAPEAAVDYFNLGLILRHQAGAGTPRGLASAMAQALHCFRTFLRTLIEPWTHSSNRGRVKTEHFKITRSPLPA